MAGEAGTRLAPYRLLAANRPLARVVAAYALFVLTDPFGSTVCLLDLSKGAR